MPKMTDERKAATIKAILESLESGSTISASCGSAGIHVSTLRNWRREDPDLEARVQETMLAQIDVVESALLKNCLEGQPASIFFFLCNRAPDRWKHRTQLDHSGSIDANVVLAFRDISADRAKDILEGGEDGDTGG